MQNIHGKEMDLLRVTVKVPGKRPPRAVTPAGPSLGPTGSGPGVNGLAAADGTIAGARMMDLTGPTSVVGSRIGLTSPVSPSVPQVCLPTPSVSDERPGAERGLQRCPSSLSTKAQSVGT